MSKLNRYGESTAELRVTIPKALIDLIDAVSISETKTSGHVTSRTDITIQILSLYFNHKIDESIVMLKLLNINPIALEENKGNLIE
jgi:hypothetical protein